MRRVLPLLVLASCNRYAMFNVTGFQQESFSPKADILFVIDNSDSMQEEASGLATSFAAFIATLGQEQADFPTDGLSDAVTFYAASTDGKGDFVNYQLGIVTTDGGDEGVLAGTIPSQPRSGVLTRFDAEIDKGFSQNLLCDSTCFLQTPPNDLSFDCGDPLGNDVSVQWLDCECGAGSWRNNCGSAQEEPIEAVFMAMCRAVPNPPVACFDPEYSSFTEQQVDPTGLIRPDATFIPVIVSDEGDDSRRMETSEIVPDVYKRLFAQFDQRMVWSYIGPDRDDDGDYRCGAGQNGTLRVQHFVESTGGLYTPINNAQCESRDFDETLAELGELLKSLNRSFRLKSIPQDGSIAVYTSDGGAVRPADLVGTSDAGVPIYEDGWSYDRPTNTVLLHGDAIPAFDETIQVFYLPIDGNPRDLPF